MIRTAFLVFFVLGVSGLQSLAQTDPALLYARGKQAYDATDCVAAYGWLYAFQQAAPPTMINPVAQDVAKAIQYCRNKIDGPLQAVPQLQAEINRLRGVGSTTQGLEIKPALPAAIFQLGPTYPMRCRGGLPVSVSGNEAHIDFETVGTAADPGSITAGSLRMAGSTDAPGRATHDLPRRTWASVSGCATGPHRRYWKLELPRSVGRCRRGVHLSGG